LLRIGAETDCRCKTQFPVACTVRKSEELSLIKMGFVPRQPVFLIDKLVSAEKMFASAKPKAGLVYGVDKAEKLIFSAR
jgi:hypothetical protein